MDSINRFPLELLVAILAHLPEEDLIQYFILGRGLRQASILQLSRNRRIILQGREYLVLFARLHALVPNAAVANVVIQDLKEPDQQAINAMRFVMPLPRIRSITFRRVNLDELFPLPGAGAPLPVGPNFQETHAADGLLNVLGELEPFFGEFPRVDSVILFINATGQFICFSNVQPGLPTLRFVDFNSLNPGNERVLVRVDMLDENWRFGTRGLRIQAEDLTPDMHVVIRNHLRQLIAVTIVGTPDEQEFRDTMEDLWTTHVRQTAEEGQNELVQDFTLEDNTRLDIFLTPLAERFLNATRLHLINCNLDGNGFYVGRLAQLQLLELDVSFLLESRFMGNNAGVMLQVDTDLTRRRFLYRYNEEQFVRVQQPLRNHAILNIRVFRLQQLRVYNNHLGLNQVLSINQ